ncbi:MAG: protein kinase [Candidatus Pacebacteria bacterium]|nr:protein kinase [Candidatus Paceibacterota bacterium]
MYRPLQELMSSHPKDFKITEELDGANRESIKNILSKFDLFDEDELTNLTDKMSVREAIDLLQLLDLKSGDRPELVIIEQELQLGESEVRRKLSQKKGKARYLLNLKRTASGGMASIIHGFDLNLAIPIVIKRLPSTEVSREKLDYLKAEAQTHANSEHKNIVRVYNYINFADTVQDQGGLLGDGIVMEGISPDHSPSLDVLTSEKSKFNTGAELDGKKVLPPELIKKLMQDMVSAIKFISESRKRRGVKAPIKHYDIKPANILMTREGFKLTDFGVSDEVIDDDISLGTPQFLSPEKALGSGELLLSDLYSLTLTLFRLITGNRIYKGKSLDMLKFEAMAGYAKDNVLDNVNDDEPTKDNPDWLLLKQYCSNYGLNLDKMITFFKEALEVETQERFQTAEEYLAAGMDAFTPIENN